MGARRSQGSTGKSDMQGGFDGAQLGVRPVPATAVIATGPRSGASPAPPAGLDALGDDVLAELIRRVREIESSYRAAAHKMGQLYMYADQHEHAALTRSLDQPMRNASANERTLAAILDELLASAKRRRPRRRAR